MTMSSTRMTADELRAVRATLGLSSEKLAERLDVRPDTVRKWESAGDPIPYGLPRDLLAIARGRAAEIESLIARLGDRESDRL